MTTIERKRTNFEGNERVDIPDHRSMLQNAFDDFRWFIKAYIDEASSRVVKRYKQGTHSGLVFKIVLDDTRAFHDSTSEWVVKTADTAGLLKGLTLAPSTTNYIEANVLSIKDDLQPRAHWDTDIGISGEEVFDDINVRIQNLENLVSNTVGFTAGSVPLWVVTTDATNILTVTSSQDLLWKHRILSLPSSNADRDGVYNSVKDLRSFIDLLGTTFGEIKGGSQRLEEVPWTSIKLLKEFIHTFISSSGSFSWEKPTADTLAWTSPILIQIPGRPITYTVATGSVVLTDQDVMYVVIPEGSSPTVLTPVVCQLTGVPLNPNSTGFDQKIFLLFFRTNNKIHGTMEIPELSSGEESTIGENLPTFIREGLGIKSETEFYPLTSTRVIEESDNRVTRESKLDDAIGAIYDSIHDEEVLGPATEGQTVFTASRFVWVPDNDVLDIFVFLNGRKVKQDRLGGTNKDFRKIANNAIEFSYPLRVNAEVTIYKPGKTGAGYNLPIYGALWSDPVDAQIVPMANEAFDIGNDAKRMRTGYFKKIIVDEVDIKGVPGQTKNIKLMINNTLDTILAGTPVSKSSNGSIVPAASDTAQGQRFIGITLDPILPTHSGRVHLVGNNIPNILSAYGFSTGDEVFIDEYNGYTNDVRTFSGNNDSIIKVGVADCPEGSASSVATDLIMFVEVISRPSI
jgi:hypothetical protein